MPISGASLGLQIASHDTGIGNRDAVVVSRLALFSLVCFMCLTRSGHVLRVAQGVREAEAAVGGEGRDARDALQESRPGRGRPQRRRGCLCQVKG